MTWWKHRNLRNLYFLLIIPLLGSWAEGYDGSMMNALQTSQEWQNFFNRPRGSLLALYNLSFSIGALLAVFPFPWGAYFADHIGRRRGVACGNIVTIIGAILQSAAQNCEESLGHGKPTPYDPGISEC